MKCPYCKKERNGSFDKIIFNALAPMILLAFIGTTIIKESDAIFMIAMLVVGMFYLVYTLLYEFGKVDGKLFWYDKFIKKSR